MNGSRLFILTILLALPAMATCAEDSVEAQVSFELDVQPILTATGCNAGACHGKQRGQNGFQLSLLGFDPDFDFDALVRQARGRRLFPSAPEASLLLAKATAQSPHGGGKRIAVDSKQYELLLAWIKQGAVRRIEGEPTLQRVELAETDFSLAPGAAAALQVHAHYSDGSSRDVTKLTTYLSNEDAIVSVDDAGGLTAGALPGETAIMARYMNHICVANTVIPQTAAVPAEVYDALPRGNFIDDHVIAKWKRLSIKPSQPAADHVFMRRVYTDIIGRLPSVDEARQFLSSDAEDKRERLIDSLLQRREYADHWATRWADLLRPNLFRVGIKAVLNYDNWIRQQFRRDVPYDQFVRDLVTAQGSTWQETPATLFRDRRSPDEVTTLVSQLFLGVRLECAKCHHHPFERWSQQDFYQFAAYFARVGHKGTGLSPPISGSEEVIYVSSKGDVKHPISGEVLKPRPLFGQAPDASAEEDPRQTLAQWMTSSENDYFAKVQVNRLWAAMMGRGLTEPVDDLRSTNPPTNPDLLEALAKDFQNSGYDLKHLIKTIAMSSSYALESTPNETNSSDRLNYSRHYRHRLQAEVLLDAVTDVTETPTDLGGMPAGGRASQLWTNRIGSTFLDTFGRPDANQSPPCQRTSESTVTQSLHLMNSRELDQRIRSADSRAARLASSGLSVPEIVDELYLAIFSRHPLPSESQYANKLIEGAENRRGVIEDVMWAMMNSPEFTIQN